MARCPFATWEPLPQNSRKCSGSISANSPAMASCVAICQTRSITADVFMHRSSCGSPVSRQVSARIQFISTVYQIVS